MSLPIFVKKKFLQKLLLPLCIKKKVSLQFFFLSKYVAAPCHYFLLTIQCRYPFQQIKKLRQLYFLKKREVTLCRYPVMQIKEVAATCRCFLYLQKLVATMCRYPVLQIKEVAPTCRYFLYLQKWVVALCCYLVLQIKEVATTCHYFFYLQNWITTL